MTKKKNYWKKKNLDVFRITEEEENCFDKKTLRSH